jgi:hypothetical protein
LCAVSGTATSNVLGDLIKEKGLLVIFRKYVENSSFKLTVCLYSNYCCYLQGQQPESEALSF